MNHRHDRYDINVVLDLDNTIIYSIPCKKIKNTDILKKFKYHKIENDYFVFERPHLQSFLTWLFKNFNVMVWSSGSPKYVDFITKNIIEKKGRKLEYILNSSDCDDSLRYFKENNMKKLEMLWNIKDLEGYGPYNTLIIDDLLNVIRTNPLNSIKIKSFIAKENFLEDQELKKMKTKLIEVKKHYRKNINNDKFKLL